jgi:hypothetical protein
VWCLLAYPDRCGAYWPILIGVELIGVELIGVELIGVELTGLLFHMLIVVVVNGRMCN